ncbi:hypothetical protein NFI96_018921, partial [Prochilodus magdalenae]
FQAAPERGVKEALPPARAHSRGPQLIPVGQEREDVDDELAGVTGGAQAYPSTHWAECRKHPGMDATHRSAKMADLALYLTNVTVTLGQNMDSEKSPNVVKDFENVELGDLGKKQKVPRRTIYFASGETMEEFSTDEEDEDEEEARAKTSAMTAVDPSKLTWGPYFWFHMWRVATSTISVCDYLGEKMASLLGITSPKYQYAIDEYYRMKKESFISGPTGRCPTGRCPTGRCPTGRCPTGRCPTGPCPTGRCPTGRCPTGHWIVLEEEEEEENRLSEEAQRRFDEQIPPETQQPAVEQPEGSASFVNVTFDIEQESNVTPDGSKVPPPIPS